jgi:sterol desaturase/sphingolipid hydroxylase (fatty acid hydroxylase superfamily)
MSVADFRARYRAAHLPQRYSGWGHFALTTSGALVAIVFAVARVEAPTLLELAVVPFSFLVANFGEYWAHRGPMHHRVRGLGVLYERHSRRHHRFYTHEAMSAESSRDFHIVLFPPVMLLFFLGALATPLGALLYFALSPNAGWLFAATAIGYFLTYEWLHLAYHLPAGALVGRLPGMRALRRLHTMHHDPRALRRCNFNITFPIADRLFGTHGGALREDPLADSLDAEEARKADPEDDIGEEDRHERKHPEVEAEGAEHPDGCSAA